MPGTRYPILIASLLACLSCPAGAGRPDTIMVLGGDMIGPYHSMKDAADPAFDAVKALFQSADIGFANQEGAIFDLDIFDGFPAAETGGGYPRSSRTTAAELAEMGIGLVSKANNHATDWGVSGLLATLHALADERIGIAGAGLDPASACAPAYRDGKSSRVALISVATTFPPMSLPVSQVSRRGTISRPGPGICAIHVHAVRLVAADQLETLRHLAGPVALAAGPDGREVRIGDQLFRAASQPGLTWDMKDEDLAPVLSSITAAHGKGALTLFAVHAHETAGMDDDMPPRDFEPLVLHRANEAASADDPTPADYVPRLLHRAVDAGADIVIRTGPHVLNGVEIYKGKPIFYSLGSLFFDFGGRRSYTAPGGQTIMLSGHWFETVIPELRFHDGKLREILIYPALIDPDAGPTGGLPRLARGAEGTAILTRLQTLSSAYGTRLIIKGGVGVIRP